MASNESCLECVSRGLALEGLVDRGEPEAVFVCKVVTGSACAVAFDERSCPEIFQAAPRRNQRLSSTFITSSSVHKEGISNPQTAPAFRAVRNRSFLAVDSNCHSWGLTNWAATDIRLNVFFCHGHHWKRCCSWEPVGFIVSACIITNIPRVTVEEWHGAKTRQTWTSQP